MDRFAEAHLQQQQQDQQMRAAASGQAPPPGAPGTTPTNPSTDPGTAPPWLRSSQDDPNNVNMSTTQPWEGGPGVTQTRVDYDTGLPEIDFDFERASNDAAQEAYAGATQFFGEDFEADRAAQEARLVNQGFQPGSEAFDRQMSLLQRGQDAARTQAAIQAGQVGHQRAGDLLARALGARASMVGERERDADRIYNQGLGIANLGLGARGQDMGLRQAQANASGAAASAAAAREASRYATDTNRDLTLRRLGLDQDSQDNNFLLGLIGASRGGVNMPNFGSTGTLDVGGAYNVAGQNANRNALERGSLAGLGASVLSGIDWGSILGG